ncbi:MAG: hypothetical protein Q7N50_10820 [Armatimonadota bacterium]|nr:hypothetical protein [Armatimonadota bacterium]
MAPHHVLTVEGGSDCRSATVYDDAGTYQRNVCGMTFVAVSGGGFAAPQQTANVRHNRTASAKPDYPVYADNSRCNDGGLCAVVGDGPYRGKYKSMKHRKPAMEMQQYAANTY